MEPNDDFAYAASLDLSEIDAAFSDLEKRMDAFTQKILANLQQIEEAFKKAFSSVEFPEAPDLSRAKPRSNEPTGDNLPQVVGGGSGMVPGGGDFGAAGADRAANSFRSLQRSLIELIAEQLKVTNANDGTTLSFIESSAATSTTVSEFKQLVTQATTLTSKEFELAKSIAGTQSKVLDLVNAFQQGKITQDQLEESAANLTVRFRELNKLQDSRISQETTTVNEEMAQSWRNLGDAIAKVAQIQQQKGSAEFQKVLRQFPQIRTEVQGLVNQYGAFSSKIIQTSGQATEQQRRFQQLLSTDKQLAAEVDRLTQEYGEFTVALNTATVGAQKQENSLGGLGKKIGITAGLTSALTQELIQMGRQGVRAFQDIIESSIQVSQEFQAARISFSAIFEGNKEVAADVFDFVRDESRKLGIDLAQIATSFLPQVESLDQLSKIAEISVELLRLPAAIAAGKGQTDAVIAISEFLAGQTRSLQTRFNITIEDTQKLKKALEEGGIDEFLTTFDVLLARLGINFEDFAATTPFLVNRVKQSVVDLQDTIGTPIDEELNRFFSFLAEFLAENETELEKFAEGVGDVVAEVAAFVGDNIIEFLEELDFEDVLADIQKFQETVKGLQSIIEVIVDIGTAIDGLNGKFEEFRQKSIFNIDIQGLDSSIDLIFPPTLDNQILNLIADIGKFNFEVDRLKATVTETFNILKLLFTDTEEAFDQLLGGFTELGNIGGQVLANYQNTIGGVLDGTVSLSDAFNRLTNTDLIPTNAIFEEFGLTMNSVTTDIDEATESTLDLADAILAAQRAAEIEIELNIAKTETQAIIDEINDDIVKANEDVNRRIFESQLALERKRIEALIKFSRDRAKIEQDYLDKLDDIDKKFLQKRDDIFVDFARDQEDASRDAGRKQAEIERELAKEKIKIEEDLQRELDRIRRQFEFDAQEAIRNNDAIAFLQLRRKLAFELDEARRKRDDDVKDAESSADEAKDKVNDKLREQIEDARIKRERGVADAQLAAERERETALENRARSIRDQTLKEQQFTEDLMLERQQRIEDLERYAAEKQAAVLDSLKDEFAALKEGQKAIAEMEQDIYELRLKQTKEYYASALEEAASFDRNLRRMIAEQPDQIEASSFDKGKVSGASGGTGSNVAGTIGQLRAIARELAESNDLLTDKLTGYIKSATRTELQNLIRDLQDGKIDDPLIPRAMGGSVLPGNKYLVGENGVEELDLSKGFPGRITPLNQTGFHLPSPGGNVSINNSRTAQVSLDMIDPSKFSAEQLVILQQVINQLFLQALG